MNFNRLHYFYVTAQEGSMTRAAEKLGVSTSTVSEQISRLEADFDALLFLRESTGLQLTARGRYVYDRASMMFRIGERAFEDPSYSPPQPVVVRAGTSASLGSLAGAHFFEPFFARDDVRCIVTHAPAFELERRVLSGELDVAVVEDVPLSGAARGLRSRVLLREKMVVVAPEGATIDAVRDPIRFISYRRGSRLQVLSEDWLQRHAVPFEGAGEVDHPGVMLRLVGSRGLWCIAPFHQAQERGLNMIAEVDFCAEIHGMTRDANISEHVAHLLDALTSPEFRDNQVD